MLYHTECIYKTPPKSRAAETRVDWEHGDSGPSEMIMQFQASQVLHTGQNQVAGPSSQEYNPGHNLVDIQDEMMGSEMNATNQLALDTFDGIADFLNGYQLGSNTPSDLPAPPEAMQQTFSTVHDPKTPVDGVAQDLLLGDGHKKVIGLKYFMCEADPLLNYTESESVPPGLLVSKNAQNRKFIGMFVSSQCRGRITDLCNWSYEIIFTLN